MQGFMVTGASPEALDSAVDADVTPLAPDDNLALAAALDRHRDDEAVLVAAAACFGDRLHTMVSVAETLSGDVKIASRVVPNASVAVLAALDIAVQSELRPAMAVQQFDRAIAHSWSGAWMRSVANLVEPAPTVRQHLRSWLPGGSGYVAIQGSSPAVVPVRALDATAVPERVAGRYLLVAGSLPPDVVDLLTHATGINVTKLVGPVTDAAQQYGVAGAVEFAAVPRHNSDVVPVAGRCLSCDEPLGGPNCPFCHVKSSDVVRAVS